MSRETDGDSPVRRARSAAGRRLEDLVRSRWKGTGGIRGLADAIGITRATMYLWFRGETQPSASTLGSLAQVLDVTPDELLAIYSEPRLGSAQTQSPGTSRSTAFLTRRRGAEPDALPQRLYLADGGADGPVAWCDADDPVGPVARTMYENDFSQVPIRDRGAWIGLLSGETITRWLAARSTRDMGYDERTPVREVLPYAEDPGSFRILPARAPAADLAAAFGSALRAGRPLAAVLLTDSGRPEGDLVAIVTPFDMPGLRGQDRR